jgi:hypothetical protein
VYLFIYVTYCILFGMVILNCNRCLSLLSFIIHSQSTGFHALWCLDAQIFK